MKTSYAPLAKYLSVVFYLAS